MDPVSIFSLVCGIVQIVDFSAKVLSTSKELYDRGSLAEHEDVDFMSIYLIKLHADLITTGRHASSGVSGEPGRQEILKLAGKCAQTALELHNQLEKLKPASKGRKREALKKSFKTIWTKKDLDRLGKELDSYQQALTTKIVINLKYVLSCGTRVSHPLSDCLP